MWKSAAIALVFAATAPGFAGADKSTPAKTIAPFVDDQTFVIIRVDVPKVKLEPVFFWLKLLLPDQPNGSEPVQLWLNALNKAEAKELFAGVSLSDPLGQAFAVVPLSEAAKAQALQPALAMLPEPVGHEVHKNFVLIGSPTVRQRLRSADAQASAELEQAFAASSGATVQAIALLPPLLRKSLREVMPQLPEELGGQGMEVVDRGFRWGALSVELPPEASLRLLIQSQNAEAAQALTEVMKRGLAWLGKNEELADNLPPVADLLGILNPKVVGDRVVMQVQQQDLTKLLGPALMRTRLDANRRQSMNNLKQIALAMHYYHDTHKTFPAAASYDVNGKPLLSWRVHILPFLDQEALYKQFRLNEPWDSAHNKKLLAIIPAPYRSPLVKDAKPGITSYVLPIGKDTIFDGPKGTKVADIPDGTSQTLLIVEVNDGNGVLWTKPDDLDIAAAEVLSRLIRPELHGFLTAFADGSVRLVSRSTDADTLRALFLRSDGR